MCQNTFSVDSPSFAEAAIALAVVAAAEQRAMSLSPARGGQPASLTVALTADEDAALLAVINGVRGSMPVEAS